MYRKPVSLDVLDRPKEERPHIMGFGTVVQVLAPSEKPIPIKYILPSPAFPSRSKKRRRADKPAGGRRKSGAGSKGPSPKGAMKKPKVDDTLVLPQTDGFYDNFDKEEFVLSETLSLSRTKKLRQLDGGSDDGSSESSSSSSGSSDDDDMSSNKSNEGDNDNDNDSSDSDDSDSDSDSSSGSIHTYTYGVDMPTPEINNHVPPVPTAKISAPQPPVNVAKKVTKPKAPRIPAIKKGRTVQNPTQSSLAEMFRDVEELMKPEAKSTIKLKGTEDELNLMECGFRHPTHFARTRVWLPEITDWCLDYSDGDPTLWVITCHAWYKIAGPMSGLLPHPSYRKEFEHTRTLFEASYRAAYVLNEWLPVNKKVSYRSCLQQIVELSLKGRYPVSAKFLIENYKFIQNQIIDLVSDKEIYVESMFFKQLQRLNEGLQVKREKQKRDEEEKLMKRVQREAERQERRQKNEEERQKLLELKEEEKRLREEEKRYPIEDLDLFEEGTGTTENILPFEVAPLNFCGLKDGKILGVLIMAWKAIKTFHNFIGLEADFSLESLVFCMIGNDTDDTGKASLDVSRVFMAFLKIILAENSFSSQMDDVVVEGNVKVSDLFATNERTYGICERPYNEMLNVLSWEEILRQLMSKDLGIDATLGFVEPLVGCEIVRQTLYMQTSSAPFNEPVDITLKGLEDYAKKIKNPMDLGTVKKKLNSGEYEGEFDGVVGHERFAADIRLIWDNAVLYNGEDSDIGKAALALSDIFEQDYQRLVIEKIKANEDLHSNCRRVKEMIARGEIPEEVSSTDVVYGLYGFNFDELPPSFKVGALSWVCAEFLKLSSVRSRMDIDVEEEATILKEHRRKIGEIDVKRRSADKSRREKEAAFRKDCVSQGIHITTLTEAKEQHGFIGKFYEELENEQKREDDNINQEKQVLENELSAILENMVIRECPLGKDRFHNNYWLLTLRNNATRLFIERSDTGDFILCTKKEQIDSLLSWLNPKGVRELNLLNRLKQISSQLQNGMDYNLSTLSVAEIRSKGDRMVPESINLFPLPDNGVIEPELLTFDVETRFIDYSFVMGKMFACIEKRLSLAGTIPKRDKSPWSVKIDQTLTFGKCKELFGLLEDVINSNDSAVETKRSSWKRKRREWRLALNGTNNWAQLFLVSSYLLDECINAEAFVDFYVQLDRKDWLKLRSKDCRNFIPDIGAQVVYFGEGHIQALKDDLKAAKGKRKFTRAFDIQSNSKRTFICQVEEVTYHHGGGDPYALLVLKPLTADRSSHKIAIRDTGSVLCPLPSPIQRLSRILSRILGKLKSHQDAVPFIEPVKDREFPEYKDIIPNPMDLSKMTAKVKSNDYRSSDEFLDDVKLICSNCELFCEDRFPMLPPLARNIVEMAEGLLKKSTKEIKAYEKAIEGESEKAEAVSEKIETKQEDPITPPARIEAILRLENRLPEFIIDLKRYETAIAREWCSGQRFRILFRDPHGFPGEYYGGIAAGALPYQENGLLPWEALRVIWDEDDGSDDSRINPWLVSRYMYLVSILIFIFYYFREAEFVNERKNKR
jgi:hypothetical protein